MSVYYKHTSIYDGTAQILSLMDEKELGGSGADSSNGDLHGVRECNVSDKAESTEAHVNGSLEKITDTENERPYKICECPWFKGDINGFCKVCKGVSMWS